MKKYFLILAVFFSIYISFVHQTFAAATGENNPNCKCAHPDSMKGNENGFSCTDNTPTTSACAANFYCQDGANGAGPKCQDGHNSSTTSGLCISLGDNIPPINSVMNSGNVCCGSDTVTNKESTCVLKASAQNDTAMTSPPPPPPPPCITPPTTGGCQGVYTAFGTWQTNPAGFVQSLFGILLGLAGGIAVFIIMLSGYKMMMSQGDPEKAAAAKESLTAAIVGLLFLIFSFVILQIIGVDLLNLPGFAK